eukprot:TRINITY_DN5288_c0_g1_i1.p1 TRINITY_DN5288_c0_g1~~TRINITY_DN5288_c0_g1_i1.p1  ORF type:complete len:671 (-),score=212.52 TRINITY_DN5288_c0_g1_i1:56-2068(-)
MNPPNVLPSTTPQPTNPPSTPQVSSQTLLEKYFTADEIVGLKRLSAKHKGAPNQQELMSDLKNLLGDQKTALYIKLVEELKKKQKQVQMAATARQPQPQIATPQPQTATIPQQTMQSTVHHNQQTHTTHQAVQHTQPHHPIVTQPSQLTQPSQPSQPPQSSTLQYNQPLIQQSHSQPMPVTQLSAPLQITSLASQLQRQILDFQSQLQSANTPAQSQQLQSQIQILQTYLSKNKMPVSSAIPQVKVQTPTVKHPLTPTPGDDQQNKRLKLAQPSPFPVPPTPQGLSTPAPPPQASSPVKAPPKQAASSSQAPAGDNDEDPEDNKRNIKDLNDVTRIAGIDLKEEASNILGGADDADSSYNGDDAQNNWTLNPGPLLHLLQESAARHGLKSIKDDVMEFVSVAMQTRLRNLMEDLIAASKHRTDSQKDDMNFTVTTDPKKYLRNLEKIEREEFERKDIEEKERLLREAKDGGGSDRSDQHMKVKAQHEEKIRVTEANITALKAIGDHRPLGQKRFPTTPTPPPPPPPTAATFTQPFPVGQIPQQMTSYLLQPGKPLTSSSTAIQPTAFNFTAANRPLTPSSFPSVSTASATAALLNQRPLAQLPFIQPKFDKSASNPITLPPSTVEIAKTRASRKINMKDFLLLVNRKSVPLNILLKIQSRRGNRSQFWSL